MAHGPGGDNPLSGRSAAAGSSRLSMSLADGNRAATIARAGSVDPVDRLERVVADHGGVVEAGERRRADLAAHRRDQDRGVAFAGRGERRPPRRARGTGSPPAPAPRRRAERSATRCASPSGRSDGRRTGTTVTGRLRSSHHAANEEELLRVLLAEVGAARPGHVEETMHHLQHAAEMTGPCRALERLADRARVGLRAGHVRRVDLLHRAAPRRRRRRARGRARGLRPRRADTSRDPRRDRTARG